MLHVICYVTNSLSFTFVYRLEMAVSRIQAARRMFSGSHNAEISGIFQVDDMELLRKLYFRSLVK